MISKINEYLYNNIFFPADVGRAISKFTHKKYPEAVAILEKIIDRLPANEIPPGVFSILGQSYLAMGEIKKAIDPLKKGFDLYQKTGKKRDSEEVRQYNELLRAYGFALQQIGRNEQAKEVLSCLG